MVTCPQCSFQCKDTARFCSKCGIKFPEASVPQQVVSSSAIPVYCAFSVEDIAFSNALRKHFSSLSRGGKIRLVGAANLSDVDPVLGEKHSRDNFRRWCVRSLSFPLREKSIVLLLVSSDFLNDEELFLFSQQLLGVIDPFLSVVPIIIRPVDWKDFLGNLQALPTDEKPISLWDKKDHAYHSIVEGIKALL